PYHVLLSSHYYVVLYTHLTHPVFLFLFFFTAPAPTELYTLSLHDALPISRTAAPVAGRAHVAARSRRGRVVPGACGRPRHRGRQDRKSTRLNSSHQIISYAVFCLKKKKKK